MSRSYWYYNITGFDERVLSAPVAMVGRSPHFKHFMKLLFRKRHS